MNGLVEDDIFRRALIDLLAPHAGAAELSMNTYTQKGKPRRSRLAGTETSTHVREQCPARISVVEYLTPRALIICWSDPQSGHYTDQLWRIGVSRRRSHCALTGMPICRGDRVFRPRTRKTYLPANCDCMILATAVLEVSYAME